MGWIPNPNNPNDPTDQVWVDDYADGWEGGAPPPSYTPAPGGVQPSSTPVAGQPGPAYTGPATTPTGGLGDGSAGNGATGTGGYGSAQDFGVPWTGDPQSFVQAVIQKLSLRGDQTNPDAINRLVQALQAHGVQASLDTRTDGLHKGIMLNGQFVKLLDGNNRWTWLPGGNAGDTGGNGIDPSKFGSLLAPYDKTYTEPADAALPRFGAPANAQLPEIPNYPDWQLPDPSQLTDPNNPIGKSFLFQMSQGQKALENSASAKGLSLHPNLRQGLINYGQDYASQAYGSLADRSLQQYLTNRDTTLGKYNLAAGAANTNYGRATDQYGFDTTRANTVRNNAYQEYQDAWNQWRTQNNDVFNKLSWQTDEGLKAASL